MTVEQMRMAIADCYPGREWSRKVDNMSDGQVIAIYRKFESQGKLDPRHPENSPKRGKRAEIPGIIDDPFPCTYGEQLSMFN